MILLKFERRFFTSKVARRIFILFIICSIFPLLIVSLSVYKTGITRLINHSLQRLEQECRGKRIEIYGRLITVESEMRRLAVRFREGYFRKTDRKGNLLTGPVSDLIKQLVIINNNDGHKIRLMGDIENLPKFSAREQSHLNSEKSLISIIRDNNGRKPAKVFMSQLIDLNETDSGLMVGRINVDYLTGIEDKDSLPQDMQMIVLESNSGCVISHTLEIENKKVVFEQLKGQPPVENIEIQHKGESYMGRFRSLFLKARFFCSDFIILMVKKKSSILSLVSDFTRNLLLFMLATLLIALFLSMFLIRKSLVPLDRLKDGTKKIADGHLGTQVEVISNDEFGELADSFNEMSTNLEKGRKILIQSAKMSALGEMSIGIIHEISQPLTSIFGYLNLLNNQNMNEKQQKYINIIQQEHKRLEGILLRFKQFSRPSEVKLEPVSLNFVIDETIKLLSHQIMGRGVNFFFQKEVNLPNIQGDQNTLKQVFINLIINSMDALETNDYTNRKIIIRTYQKQDIVIVDVEDNGPGIPPKVREKIFDPFFTTKSVEKGSGLGLSIVNNILDQHHAGLELESKVGSGTKFTISFKAFDESNPAEQ